MDSEPAIRVIELRSLLNHCPHGREVRHLTAELAPNGWLIWGHYPCSQCRRVALDFFHGERPSQASIAGRQLEIHQVASPEADFRDPG